MPYQWDSSQNKVKGRTQRGPSFFAVELRVKEAFSHWEDLEYDKREWKEAFALWCLYELLGMTASAYSISPWSDWQHESNNEPTVIVWFLPPAYGAKRKKSQAIRQRSHLRTLYHHWCRINWINRWWYSAPITAHTFWDALQTLRPMHWNNSVSTD